MALRMCVSVDMTIVWIGMRKRIRIRNDIYTCERKKESLEEWKTKDRQEKEGLNYG